MPVREGKEMALKKTARLVFADRNVARLAWETVCMIEGFESDHWRGPVETDTRAIVYLGADRAEFESVRRELEGTGAFPDMKVLDTHLPRADS
jgi:hypothetical protein